MPITKTGTALIKMAMPRWRAVFQLLSKLNQRRIQQSGIMKSQRSKLLGMQRGNQNMREQLGYSRVNPANISADDLDVHKGKILQSMMESHKENPVKWIRDEKVRNNLDVFRQNYVNTRPNPTSNPSDIANVGADPKHKLLYVNKYSILKQVKIPSPFGQDGKSLVIRPPRSLDKAKNRRMLDAFMERHELYEAQAWEKALGRSIKNGGSGTMGEAKSFLKHPGKLKSAHSGNEYTNHADMNVFVKERRDLDTFTHTSNPAYKFVRKVRDAVERPYMDAAGGFDPAKAVQPYKPIDVFKNHESRFFRNTKNPVPVGNDLISPAK